MLIFFRNDLQESEEEPGVIYSVIYSVIYKQLWNNYAEPHIYECNKYLSVYLEGAQ